MARATKHIPEGVQTLTPDLAIKGAGEAIEFYKKVFGAREISRSPGPDGKMLMHAQLVIGNSPIFLADVFPGMEEQRGQQDQLAVGSAGGPEHSRVVLNLYVEDADAVFDRAVKAGAQVIMPLADMFLGRSLRTGPRSVRARLGHCNAQGRPHARGDREAERRVLREHGA